jgi:hypothetical protein
MRITSSCVFAFYPKTLGWSSITFRSPRRPVAAEQSSAVAPLPAASADAAEVSDRQVAVDRDELQGLETMERRLLTLLEMTAEDDHDRRKSLETSLAAVRNQQACLEIRISPHQAGAALRLPAEKAAECVGSEPVGSPEAASAGS